MTNFAKDNNVPAQKIADAATSATTLIAAGGTGTTLLSWMVNNSDAITLLCAIATAGAVVITAIINAYWRWKDHAK